VTRESGGGRHDGGVYRLASGDLLGEVLVVALLVRGGPRRLA
jgi:hypothetical protein